MGAYFCYILFFFFIFSFPRSRPRFASILRLNRRNRGPNPDEKFETFIWLKKNGGIKIGDQKDELYGTQTRVQGKYSV